MSKIYHFCVCVCVEGWGGGGSALLPEWKRDRRKEGRKRCRIAGRRAGLKSGGDEEIHYELGVE